MNSEPSEKPAKTAPPSGSSEAASDPSSTRERLLEVAARLFAERGKEAVSIREIAAEAGVRHGGINYHFRSKDDLYIEALMRFGPVAHHSILLQPIPSGMSPDEAKRFFAAMVRQLVELEVEQLNPVAAGLFRGELASHEGPNEMLVERVIRPHHQGMANLIGQMFPELTDARERNVAAFNVISQFVFLRVARPVALTLFGVEDFDADLTGLIADRIIQTALLGLKVSVVERS